jgi:CRP-like cAMP-binding protein
MDKFKAFLKKITSISDQEYLISKQYFSEIDIVKGDFFIKQNQKSLYLAFILEGSFKVYKTNNNGNDLVTCFCLENNFISAYKNFILQNPSELTIQAIEDAKLLVINYINLQKLYKEVPVWQTIARVITEHEFISAEAHISFVNNEFAKEKYLQLLKKQPKVIKMAKLQDIASYLGVTRRTLSRIRKEIAPNSI